MENQAAMDQDPGDYASLEAMEDGPVTVLLGPMGSLSQQLRRAIAWHYRNQKGIKCKIRLLRQGLEGLCTHLEDLSRVGVEDTITRCWVRQIRDLCYDTSDYLDELMHFRRCSSGTRPRTGRPFLGSMIFRVSKRPACNQLRRSLPIGKRLRPVRLIAKLSALVARVEDADDRRTRFKLSPAQASCIHDDAQADGVSYLCFPQLPLQLHFDNLVKLLGFEHEHIKKKFKVATIFGSAGAGKTSAARTVYHKHREMFQYRAFVRVSRAPDTRRLLADLLAQIKAPPAPAFSNVKQLIASITKHLQGKSYLIIIDDLWDTLTWDIISCALPDGDYCRIIITTQIEDVALACCSDQLKHIYAITPLSDDRSGISIGVCTEVMKAALNYVYDKLPPHLKTCLLYLNIYPEGWTVLKGDLVKQWVAEGFIRPVKGQNAEQTAGCYFDDLVSKGIVKVVDTNHNDEVLSCTLHHMVLDLIRQESMEENFITIVNYFHTVIGLPDKVRRLSVQLGGAKGANNISENMRISQVRSLVFCGFFRSVPSIMEYENVQVLILHIWSDQDSIFDLTTIGELYRLRCLKIECSITVKLPPKIRRLQQLGTLQVDARLDAVPSDIFHLEKLLHLRLRSECILPHGVRRMTCLRTLGSFDLSCNSEDNVRDLGELENLQDLQLTCSAVQPAESQENNVKLVLSSVLKKRSMLQSVTLAPAAASCNVNTLQDGAGASTMIISRIVSSTIEFPAHLRRLELSRRCCIFGRLPKWLRVLAQLCILKIAVEELWNQDLPILNKLPALASLSLHMVTASSQKIVFQKDKFSVLKYFKFTCMVPWLEFEEGTMSKLQKLKLCFNAPIVDRQGNTQIVIERMIELKEIYVMIDSVGVDAECDWGKAITNNEENPEVKFNGWIYYGDQGKGTETSQGSEEDEKNEADIRNHMKPESSHLPVPALCREDEPEDRPLISEIISIPSESESTYGHTDQVVMHGKQTAGSGHSGGGGRLSQGVVGAHGGGGSLSKQGQLNSAASAWEPLRRRPQLSTLPPADSAHFARSVELRGFQTTSAGDCGDFQTTGGTRAGKGVPEFPEGYFIGRPSSIAGQGDSAPVEQRVNESLPGDYGNAPPGGYFIGRPSSIADEGDFAPVEQRVNESLPGDYFVGRPSNTPPGDSHRPIGAPVIKWASTGDLHIALPFPKAK